jgi:hypothetical protein
MKNFAYVAMAATLLLAASVLPAQLGGLGRIKDAVKKAEEAVPSRNTNPPSPSTTQQTPDAQLAGTPAPDPGNQQQRGWERAQVSNLSHWYAQKAFLTEACNPGGGAAVKAEMASFVGSQDAGLVEAANSAFDQAYSSRLRSGLDTARQACGTNRHSGNIKSAESTLDQAKANFLQQMRLRQQQSPVATDRQSPPPTYPGVSTEESIAAAQRQQEAEAPAKIPPSDPRVAGLSATDRELALNEANNIAPYCAENMTLGNFYDCGCFAGRLLDERLKAGLETRFDPRGRQTVLVVPTSSLVMKMTSSQDGVRECVAPAKIQRYGARRVAEINFSMPEPRRSQISACVGADIASKFQAKPIGDMIYINKLMSDAMVACNRAGQ